MKGEVGDIGVLAFKRRVKGTMNAYDDPFDVGVTSCLFEILLEIVELLAAQIIRVL